jgi:hypothetical protein
MQHGGDRSMSKKKAWITAVATVVATVFVASITMETAVAQRGHGSGGHSMGGGSARSFSGGSSRSFSGGSRSYSGSSYSSGRSYSRTFRGPSLGSRTYAYNSYGNHRHHRHFRGRSFAYGYPYVDGYYAYSDGCYWLRRRALSTGSSYWWNRYYDCTNGSDYD